MKVLGWGNALLYVTVLIAAVILASTTTPEPPGQLVDLGGHRLHVNCTGKGGPLIVVENGLGDFSFDWFIVQSRISKLTRICTYDRAGYAWSEPGPKPRTFAQLNLELRDALQKLREPGPFVLVGHSYGGPVVRNFALTFPQLVAGVVLVDSAFEGQRVGIGGRSMIRLGEHAAGHEIPIAHEEMSASDKSATVTNAAANSSLDRIYAVLPKKQQEWQVWAQSQSQLEDAEDSQRQWSEEYFAKWLATPQDGALGTIPLVVLTRSNGQYVDGEYEISAAQLESERKEGQSKLARLSTNSRQIMIASGHNMELEAPDQVVDALRLIVDVVRHKKKL